MMRVQLRASIRVPRVDQAAMLVRVSGQMQAMNQQTLHPVRSFEIDATTNSNLALLSPSSSDRGACFVLEIGILLENAIKLCLLDFGQNRTAEQEMSKTRFRYRRINST